MMTMLWIAFCFLINKAAMSIQTSYWTTVVKLQEKLCDLIEPDDGLLDILLSLEVLLNREYDDVRSERTVHRRNRLLLELMVKENEQLRYADFLKALAESGQQHIVNFISDSGDVSAQHGDVRPLTAAELRRINTNRLTLIQQMEPHTGLLNCMETFNSVSVSQQQHITETQTTLDMNRKLLDILSRESFANLNKFLDCLKSGRQAHLIYLFTEDAKKYAGISAHISAKVGATVRLPCNTTSDLPVDWRFQRNATIDETYVCTATDQGLTNCEHFSEWPRIAVNLPLPTPSDYTLTIRNVTFSDSGLYHCVKEGGAGTRHTIKLTVISPVCASHPCQNNGRCSEGDNWYTCACPAGFIGTNCDLDVEVLCLSEPCQNGGRCVTGDNMYACNCLPGFAGTNCEEVSVVIKERPVESNVTVIIIAVITTLVVVVVVAVVVAVVVTVFGLRRRRTRLRIEQRNRNADEIVDLLTIGEARIGQHASIIRQHYIFLLERLDSSDSSGLTEKLCNDNVIDAAERDDIASIASLTQRNKKLLSMLSRKSAEQFELFIDALNKTGQTFIARVLSAVVVTVRMPLVTNDSTTTAGTEALQQQQQREYSQEEVCHQDVQEQVQNEIINMLTKIMPLCQTSADLQLLVDELRDQKLPANRMKDIIDEMHTFISTHPQLGPEIQPALTHLVMNLLRCNLRVSHVFSG